jgi:hypothetical protein
MSSAVCDAWSHRCAGCLTKHSPSAHSVCCALYLDKATGAGISECHDAHAVFVDSICSAPYPGSERPEKSKIPGSYFVFCDLGRALASADRQEMSRAGSWHACRERGGGSAHRCAPSKKGQQLSEPVSQSTWKGRERSHEAQDRQRARTRDDPAAFLPLWSGWSVMYGATRR